MTIPTNLTTLNTQGFISGYPLESGKEFLSKPALTLERKLSITRDQEHSVDLAALKSTTSGLDQRFSIDWGQTVKLCTGPCNMLFLLRNIDSVLPCICSVIDYR